MLFAGHRDCPHQKQTKSLELTRSDEFESALATTGQKGRSTADAGGNLQLVHRGVYTKDLQEAKALLESLT